MVFLNRGTADDETQPEILDENCHFFRLHSGCMSSHTARHPRPRTRRSHRRVLAAPALATRATRAARQWASSQGVVPEAHLASEL